MLSTKTQLSTNVIVTNKDCSHAYNVCVNTFYPDRRMPANVQPQFFNRMAILLSRHNITAHDYYLWAIGVRDRTPQPPLPKYFENAKLIQEYLYRH